MANTSVAEIKNVQKFMNKQLLFEVENLKTH